MTTRPVYWLIHTKSGWLVRRFWYGTYSTVGVYPTREAAAAKLQKLGGGGM